MALPVNVPGSFVVTNDQPLDLLLAGGGTGGHTVAATVIADVAAGLGYNVAWAARPDSYESKVAAENGIPYWPVPAHRVHPKHAPQLIQSILTARRLIQRLSPRLVIATGSWVCLPVAFGAKLAGVPLIVHEQTLIPGSATTFLSRFAAETWVTYEPSTSFFPASAQLVHTGFPLRPVLRQPVSRADGLASFGLAEQPTLFVAGGGSGAESLNSYIERHLDDLLGVWQIIHQAGSSPKLTTPAEVLQRRRADLPAALRDRYHVAGYFTGEQVNAALRSADLVLARAGAGFVNEVAQLQTPTVFVPYPYSVKGEQDALAELLVPTGRALVWPDHELRSDAPERLVQLLDWHALKPTDQPSPILTTDQSVALIRQRLQSFLG
ncbi:MAG: UDP-N-acetylglucosamine--N-acetylmuramyl-(pentapeptide) pyrophosphoryl-undecaprenol N-acetylglucosamine transferase [Propionibacteriaceae bacterium]|nr:UDP-N-acetylglucosamine--N-acetylmuramyl-(pentapeptide) pyrophosphoryl-undecaprenol N-acetylglucosamine transferase [Propionibacteriaceae bacterium]